MYGVANLIWKSFVQALTDGGRLLAKEGVIVTIPCKLRANILKHVSLLISKDCMVDLVSAILAFAQDGEADWTVSDCLNWFLFDLAKATIMSAPE